MGRVANPDSSRDPSNHPVKDDSFSWHATLTLRERAHLCRPGALPVSANDQAAAAETVRDWCNAIGFNTEEMARRLAADQITEEEFRALLGRPSDATCGQARPPSWLIEFRRAFASASPFGLRPPQAVIIDTTNPSSELGRPLIERAAKGIRREAKKLFAGNPSASPIDWERTDALFLPQITGTISEIVNSTLVHEMWEAKARGELVGETSANRFRNFLERLCSRSGALSLFAKYPVLARLVTEAVGRWASGTLEFLGRLSIDWPQIKESILGDEAPGRISRVDSSADSHQQGRRVWVLTLDSGLKFVYKPRPIGIALHFQDLLEWLNACDKGLQFRTIRILDKATYGWSEFVDHSSCNSEEEVARFYERQGGYLALLYVLQATDIHQENVIASGQHPIIIDVESLFHPQINLAEKAEPGYAARVALADSAMRVGLLPQYFGANGSHGGLQLGGLARRGGQETARAVPVWVDVGTDEMRLERRHIPLSESHNLPILLGKNPDLLDHEPRVIDGFSRVYRTLMERASELLSVNGPLANFRSDSNRILLRHTDFYAATLRESYNWRVMRNALTRDRVFYHLWGVTRRRPEMTTVFPSECEDLWAGDIPLFSTCVNSPDLFDSCGKIIPQFFPRSGLDCARQKLSELSEIDLHRQSWFIRASFASLSVDGNHRQKPRIKTIGDGEHPDSDGFVDAALAIGERIGELACRRDGVGPDWLGLLPTKTGGWIVAPIGYDLYNGSAGVCLFLAYLGAISGRKGYTDLAREVATPLRKMSFTKVGSIGAFDGIAGIIYSLSHLAALWKDAEILSELEKHIPLLRSRIEQDLVLEIVGGSAGCIGGLISFLSQTNSSECLKTMVLCGERLLERWDAKRLPLSGFSHGAAGIAWSLVQLARITAEQKFLTKAIEVIQYERTLFSSAADNWRDLREPVQAEASSASPQFMTAWCHGSAGIGLSRLAMLPYVDDVHMLSEIQSALRSTVSHGFGASHCLCHGDLGSLELLLSAERVLGDPLRREYRQIYSTELCRQIKSQDRICGVPNGVETPGFMVGLAGIGYGLLRLAFPDSVPSVLLLEPPIKG